MALINCPECKNQVSSNAVACPHCGFRIMEFNRQIYRQQQLRKKKEERKIIFIIFGVIFAGLFILIASLKIGLSIRQNKLSNTKTTATSKSEYAPDTQQTENNESENNVTPEKEVLDYTISNTTFYTYNNVLNKIGYCFILEITNTGTCPLSLEDCYVDFEDADEHLIATEKFISSCPDIINPGEKGYFYNGGLSLTLDADISINDEVYAVPHINITESKYAPIDYLVSDTSITKNHNTAKILGRVTNNTAKDDPLLYLNVIFYDADGNVIGITGTNITDLDSGTTKSFECTSMYAAGNFDYDEIYEYEIIARQ